MLIKTLSKISGPKSLLQLQSCEQHAFNNKKILCAKVVYVLAQNICAPKNVEQTYAFCNITF